MKTLLALSVLLSATAFAAPSTLEYCQGPGLRLVVMSDGHLLIETVRKADLTISHIESLGDGSTIYSGSDFELIVQNNAQGKMGHLSADALGITGLDLRCE